MLSTLVFILKVEVGNFTTEASQLSWSVEVSFDFIQSSLLGCFGFKSELLCLGLLFFWSWATLSCLSVFLWGLCFSWWGCLLLWVVSSCVCASLLLSSKSVSQLLIPRHHAWCRTLICFSFWFINIGEYLMCEISKLRRVFHRNQS